MVDLKKLKKVSKFKISNVTYGPILGSAFLDGQYHPCHLKKILIIVDA